MFGVACHILPELRSVLIAAGLWGATVACAFVGFWLSEIVMSEEAMRKLGPLLSTLASVAFFLIPLVTVAVGALACWRTVPAKKRQSSSRNLTESHTLIVRMGWQKSKTMLGSG